MKKIYLLISVLTIAILISWVSLEKTSLAQKSKNSQTKVEEKAIELTFAHHLPEDSIIGKLTLLYASEIEKKTEGRVRITVQPNQKLGTSQKMLELTRAGEIDIFLIPTAKITPLIPSMQFPDLPFLFPTQQDVHDILDGKIGTSLLKDLSKIDLLGVSFWDGGYKNIMSKKELTTVEDFKNKNVRVMKSSLIMEQFSALGANPITIDFHKINDALNDGVIDIIEATLYAISAMNFDASLKNILLEKHAYLPYVVAFSKKSFVNLPLGVQHTLFKTLKEFTPIQREETKKASNKALENLKMRGLHVSELSKKEQEKFKAKTAYIIKRYEGIIGSDLISKTQEYMYKKYNKDDVVVIGVDADLSGGAKGAELAIKRGTQLAVDKINKQGGLLGKKVVVIAKDHQGISTQANENIDEFIEDENTLAVIGGKHSAVINSYMKKIQNNHLILFSPWAAAPSVTENGYKDNYVFRVSLNDRFASKFLVKTALKANEYPIVIVENSIWGKEALKNINLYFKENNMQEQKGIIINRGESKFEEVLETLHEQRYDSIIMVLNAKESIKLVQQLHKKDINIPIVSHWGMVGDAFFKETKEYLDGMDLRFIQTFSLLKQHNKQAKELERAYLKAYAKTTNENINAITGVVQAYDSVMLLATAVKQSSSLESIKIKSALENLTTYNGVLKTYKKPFDAINHDALKENNFFMAKFDKNGSIIPINK